MKKIKVSKIIEGNKKRLLGIEEEFSKDRLEVCNNCEFKTFLGNCGICHCPVKSKTKVKNEFCPMNKWKDAIMFKKYGIGVVNVNEELYDMQKEMSQSGVKFTLKQPLTENNSLITFRLVNERDIYLDDPSTFIITDIAIGVGCKPCTSVVNTTSTITVKENENFFDFTVKLLPSKISKGKFSKNVKIYSTNKNTSFNLIIKFEGVK